ncbi:fluconazole resistance protein, partial [Fusarium sp. NRRL 25303]
MSDQVTITPEMVSDREDHKPAIDDQYPDHLVTFDGPDDPYNPMNWPFRKKFITTISYGLTTCWITLASAIFAAAIEPVSAEFNVNTETSAAATSLLVFGFGLGPLVWGPLSELYGRKWLILIPYFIAAVFSFGTATAKDIQTILITRFFSGLFGSAPVTITGGVMADIWAPHQLGNAIVAYGVTIVGGPTLGPIIGGALCSSSLGWRWTEYLTGIIMMAQLAVDLLVLDESYAPILLARKAHKLRLRTQDWALHAKHEEWDVSFRELYQKYFIRPFQMMATPICFLMSLYASFVYGILYANLESFSIEYQEVRQWGPVVGTLPFIALLIGILCAAVINIYNNKYYRKRLMENGYRAVPEARLPPMMLGGIVFTAGQFLFAWTSSPNINYWPSIIGIALTGLGFTTIFQAALGYLIDTFTRYSASAVAANTFMRSMFSGAFPLFIIPMYHKLGVNWGTTVFGCIAAALIPVPYLFFVWGKRIRGNQVQQQVHQALSSTMELCTVTRHNAEIQDRLQALEYEVHVLKLGSGSLARRFGLNNNLEYDAKSFLSVSESLEEGEVLEYPSIDYWPAARKQGEIQRRTKALENGIRVMKWNFGLQDTINAPCSSVLVKKVNTVPPEDTYCLAPEFESLLDGLLQCGMIEKNKQLYYTSTAAHPKQQKENEIMMACRFRRHENPEIAGTIPELNPKLRAGRIKANPHPNLSIKHSILTDSILDANRGIRNAACSLYLRRECKPQYIYSFNELEGGMFYDWQWLQFLQPGDVLAGDIEVLCIRNQMICDMIDNREDPIFEDRAALWPSVVFERLKPDFREIERSGFRVLAWRLCK